MYFFRSSGHLDQELYRYAETAELEISRVARIAKRTLSFYRESNRPLRTDMPELVDGLLAMYGQKIDSQIGVSRRYYAVRPLIAYTSQVRQVFSNLIGNALEAMHHGGTLKLRIRDSFLWSRPEVKGVRVTIGDTGSGISPDNRARIFQPFFTTKGDHGTGLGLWVSQGIIASHNGTIQVCSSIRPNDHGTVFSRVPTA